MPKDVDGRDVSETVPMDRVAGKSGPGPVAVVGVVAAALLGQFLAVVSGLGTFGIARPGHHLSDTPARDLVGGFFWIAIPGFALLAVAVALLRLGHPVVAYVVLGVMWLASLAACFLVWSDMGDTCSSSDGEPTCPGRGFVAIGVICAVVGITAIAGVACAVSKGGTASAPA